MSRATRARRLAAAAAFGGGGVGLAAAGGYGLLALQAKLARGTIGEPTTEPPQADGIYGTGTGTPLSFAVLGDSSAAGLGVDSPRETPPALLATGVAGASGRLVRVTTFAAIGAMSRDLDGQVERALAVHAELAVIMIGANDVTHRVRVPDAVRDLAAAVTRLRQHGCPVVVVTCPDLGTIEPIAPPLRWVARRWSRQLAAVQTIAVVEAGGRTVSLGDLLGPEFAASEMFSLDRFHPSASGYASAAGAILPSLLASLGLVEGDTPESIRGEGVLPVARAAVEAAERGGTEVTGTAVRGADRGPRGRATDGAARQCRPSRSSPPAPSSRARDARTVAVASTALDPAVASTPLEPSAVAEPPLGGPMPEAVVVATGRSPIGRAGKGSLRDVRPDHLLATVIRAVLESVPSLDPAELDDLYVGCAEPEGEQGLNLARRVAVALGYDALPAATVNRFCASSLQTTRMGFHAIKAGEGHAFVSSGVECVSRYPSFTGAGEGRAAFYDPDFDEARARTGKTAETNETWHDPRDDGQLPDVYIAMGQTAENLATSRGISRHEQDEFAVRSQHNAERAIANGFFEREIVPITLPDGTVVSRDDGPRPGVTLEGVSALKPVFRPDGTVTAGNCCALNDGAAAVVIMSDVRAAELGLQPLARIVSTGVSALSPEIMGLGPVEASHRALAHAGMSIGDVDLVEINEAFAAQVIPSYQDLGIDPDRLNVHGGAIALGHPFGQTGARILTTLLNGLRTRDETIGLETMCVGGGQGMAMVVERLS
jgi:acetyl-CoA C-acetyltransferase